MRTPPAPWLAAATVAALLAGAGGASAASLTRSGFSTLRPGDTIAVAGAALGCRATSGGIACYPTAAAGASAQRAATFAVVLAAPGTARIRRAAAGGSSTDVAVRSFAGAATSATRTAGGAAAVVRLKVGQVARLRPSGLRWPLDCAVVKSAGLPTLYCSLDDAKGPVPGTYAVIVNERQAGLGRIEDSRETTVTDVRAQPR